jgi:hypothetical protein
MFSHPSFVSSDARRDTQSETFLAQQAIATVTGTERPNFPFGRTMRD